MSNQHVMWLVLCLFVSVIISDLAYVLIVQNQPDIIINSWFVIFPFLSVFYLMCSIIAVSGLYRRMAWGTIFAYIAMLFGASSATISYSLAYTNTVLHSFYVYLLIYNLFVALCLAYYGAISNTNK